MPPYAIVEAPTNLGLWPSGVERLGDALLAAGLAERLGARRAARVEPPAYDGRRDPATGVLNPHAIAGYSARLADAVGAVLDGGEVPTVLGGDRSVLLGGLLALRRRGRFGLLFLDGHLDFASPEAERAGEAASMELAFATGDGPAVVADLEGLAPLVRREDVVALGMRDGLQPLGHEQRASPTPSRWASCASTSRRCAGTAPPGPPRAPWRTWGARTGPGGSGSISTPTCSTTP